MKLTIDPDDRDAIKDLADGIWHRLGQGASDREAVEATVRDLADTARA